jgi:galactose mutarotase-like enzyme
MFFSVGGHPAFKVPILPATHFEDYNLLFEQKENAGRYPLSKDGLIESAPIPLLANTNELPLSKDLFKSDALVFKELQSKTVSIVSDKTLHGLKVTFEGFPYLGIWSTKGADFVCIEPWCGIADTVTSTGNLQEKEGIQKLGSGATFTRTFSVEVF